MNIKKILPSLTNVRKFITPKTKCLSGHLEYETIGRASAYSEVSDINRFAGESITEYRPVVISEKAKKALEAINSMRNKALMDEVIEKGDFLSEPFVVRFKMQNGDTVELSREWELHPGLDISFLDKEGKEREKVSVATHSVICNESVDYCLVKGQVNAYSNYRNKVMRPTDPMNQEPKREMTFEETVSMRPVILKRINSLIEKLGEEVTNH